MLNFATNFMSHSIHTIISNVNKERLDQALAELFPEYSRTRLQTWIKNGQVTVDGQILRPRDKILAGQQIVLTASIEPNETWIAQPINLDIVYQDSDIMIINKPAGLVVHPAAGNPDNTLLNALLYHVPELSKLPRAGIIHRLDKDTSGLLIVAKSIAAHTKLTAEMQEHKITREYEAVVNGNIISGGTINTAFGRHSKDRKRMAVVQNGKVAITHYRVVKRFQSHTHIKVILETGRTHQIRVHLKEKGHPVLGDWQSVKEFYSSYHPPRLMLHAVKLSFTHPVTEEKMEVKQLKRIADAIEEILRIVKKDMEPKKNEDKI